jgi:Leucine-rich repeat (LRR) protein
MENNAPQYQRATTPTVDTIQNKPIRGKVLSYQSQIRRRIDSIGPNKDFNAANIVPSLITPSVNSLNRPNGQTQNLNIGTKPVQQQRIQRSHANEFNIQGKSSSNNRSNSVTKGENSNFEQGHANDNSAKNTNLSGGNSSVLRHDIKPLSDDIPSDGVIFARIRNDSDSLVVFRTPDERLRNPERLNLDRRQLEKCPILEQEQRLRLLNYQNNNIRLIQNLENLPNLIFLDLYNNKLSSLEGAVSSVRGLRVLMAGKNRINSISNLSHLRKLDVLDLHSNEIRIIEGLNGLTDLRVLNLAGNRVNVIENLSSLQSLTELNLRRNNIERIFDLNHLPSLQRVFLSHNSITMSTDVQCLFNVPSLIELSLDGNPMSDSDPVVYRNHMITSIISLRHLDLKKITDEERTLAFEIIKEAEFKSLEPEVNASELIENKANDDENKVELINVNIENNATFEIKNNLVIDDSISNHNFEESNKWKSNTILNGLATQARTGKITNNQSLLDLEMIGPNEKALIAVGDSWEWVQSKRLFNNVTEVKYTIINIIILFKIFYKIYYYYDYYYYLGFIISYEKRCYY